MHIFYDAVITVAAQLGGWPEAFQPRQDAGLQRSTMPCRCYIDTARGGEQL
jgi:hypothetical protein